MPDDGRLRPLSGAWRRNSDVLRLVRRQWLDAVRTPLQQASQNKHATRASVFCKTWIHLLALRACTFGISGTPAATEMSPATEAIHKAEPGINECLERAEPCESQSETHSTVDRF